MKSKLAIIGMLSVIAVLSGCGDNAAEQKAQQEREKTAKSLKPVDKAIFDRGSTAPTQNQAPSK